MTDAKQTKCPHCGSTFRISDAQLAARGGSVRCGSCLQVFRADLHLINGATPPKLATPIAAPIVTEPPKESGGNGEPSVSLQEGVSVAGRGHDEQIDKPTGTGNGRDTVLHRPSGFDDELNDLLSGTEQGIRTYGGPRRSGEGIDESWAQNLLHELEHDEKNREPENRQELSGGQNVLTRTTKPTLTIGLNTLGTLSLTSAPPRIKPIVPDFVLEPEDENDLLGGDSDVLNFLNNDNVGGHTVSLEGATPFLLDRPLAHVDAPVVLKPPLQPINWGYILGWGLLCLMAIAMFLAQYTYFNFNSLIIDPTVRPYFEQTCMWFGCRLPNVPDLAKVKVDELIVRKHPTVAGVLVLDALIKNEASFPQPFPLLLLSFTNNANEIAASRVLSPADYLHGDAHNLGNMPPDTPIHLSLDIVDPGKDIVNYSLTPLHRTPTS